MPARSSVHRVGLTAAVIGLSSLLFLNFGSVSPNRVVTPEGLSVFAVLPPWGVALALAPWLAVALSSLRGARSRSAALTRGLAAAVGIVAWLWLSGLGAERLLAGGPEFGRYSIGGAVWAAWFAAFAMVVSSRRELGLTGVPGWAVTLVAPVGAVALAASGRLGALGIAVEYRNVADEFWDNVWLQLVYTAAAVVVASAIGIALGIVAHRYQRWAKTVFTAANVFQTIPGLAMIGILVVPFGMLAQRFPGLRSLGIGALGWVPVLTALTLYALLAIVRNTYAGLGAVPGSAVEAGRGMGMTPAQVMRKVQLPLAAPILFSGVRTSTQQTVGNATLGAMVFAGGLGVYIFGGFAQQANDLVLLGSVALVALALTLDGLMRTAQRLLTPARRGRGGGQ